MFISPAYAQTGASGSDMFLQLAPLLAMFVIFYFLLIRPQNNRMKKHREMLSQMKKGDTVITQGGIIGRIFKMDDNEVTIDTGEGGKLRIVRAMIVEVKNPSAPAPANDSKAS